MVQIIQDLTVLLLVSLPINILFHKIKLPSVMGFLIAGILIGPHALQWIGDPVSVNHLAEIGIILLLFIIGLEFSLGHLLKNLARLAGAGGLQLGLTALPVYGLLIQQGFSNAQSLILGLLVGLSSTAIVLKMVTDRAEIDTIHGKLCIGILLFQDICVLPLMILVPLMAQTGPTGLSELAFAIIKSIGAVVAIFFLARLLVPRALDAIARTGNKEHLTLFVILLILGTGWISHQVGLSLAMGAFIAGVILSESEYHHQIILDILPVKDYFGSIFFISVGMLLEPQYFFQSPWLLLGLALGIIAFKTVVAMVSAMAVGTSLRLSFIAGLRLAQVGEFSLILAGLALQQNLLDDTLYQSFLILSILTMLAAPMLIQGSIGASIALFSRFRTVTEDKTPSEKKENLKDHVIIVGYGLVGRNLGRVLKEINIPFMVIELDGERIKQALTEKAMVMYGDPTHRGTLNRTVIQQARVLVVAIPDIQATEQVVRLSRQLNPDLYILAQTRFAAQVDDLTRAGANQVIPEEFETSIEIFSRVLREFRVPNNIIEQQVELVRLEGYGMFRGLSLNVESMRKFSTYLAASLSKSFQVLEDSWSLGKSIEDINLKDSTGATLIAVVRNNQAQPNPEDHYVVERGDTLILFGRHAQVDFALRYLETGPEDKSVSDAPSA